MKKIYTVILLSISLICNAQNWQWAKSPVGSTGSGSNSVVVDGSGNTYVTGGFRGSSVSFGGIVLSSSGNSNMYIVKYDATGNVVWAQSSSGSSTNSGNGGNSIALDGSGNIYVTGYFKSTTITFGSTTLTNAGYTGSQDFFIVKYSSSGSFVWAKSAGGTADDLGNSIAVDASGNIYVTGSFSSSSITFGSITLANASITDMFIVKYDASGTELWAKSPTTGSSFGNSITVDGSGNPIVTGNFSDSTVIFGSIILTNTPSPGGSFSNIFVVKYDASGNEVWAKSAGGRYSDEGHAIVADGLGNTYVTGIFDDSLTFGSNLLIPTGGSSAPEIFIVKYDASGNVVWSNSAGTTDGEEINGISLDGSGNIYLIGSFHNTTFTFGSTTLTNNGGWDILILKYDTIGNPSWAKSSGGLNWDFGNGIAIDGTGNIYVTGYFLSSSITFGSTTLSTTNNDMYIWKLCNNPAASPTITSSGSTSFC